MSAGEMKPDIHQHFPSEEDAVDYYSRNLLRPQVNRLAEIESVDIDKENISDDCEVLLEKGALDTFHEYNSELYRIGSSTIIEGIRSIEAERLTEVSDREMEDKEALILYLMDWDWKDKLEIIRALKTFKTKRTYERKSVSGERSFEELTEEVKEEIQERYEQELPELNDRRKHKIKYKDTEIIEEDSLMIRFEAEKKASNYRQFSFREQEDWEFESDSDMETETIKYWPLTTEYLYIDYRKKEYDYDISRSEEELSEIAIVTLFDEPEFGDDVQFADPMEFPDRTPNEFVSDRVEEQKELIEEEGLIEEEKRERYLEILDNLESVKQTAITLENVNVEGSPNIIEIDTDESLSEFLAANNLEEQFEEFNEKSQQREYTLHLAGREIRVSSSKITIRGSVSKEEEQVITSLLREGGATI
jgi:hypothetical protein